MNKIRERGKVFEGEETMAELNLKLKVVELDSRTLRKETIFCMRRTQH